MESPLARNEALNLSTDRSTTVLELAQMIWQKVHGDEPFRLVCDAPYAGPRRPEASPSVEKARRLLGFIATTSLSASLDEIIPWIKA